MTTKTTGCDGDFRSSKVSFTFPLQETAAAVALKGDKDDDSNKDNDQVAPSSSVNEAMPVISSLPQILVERDLENGGNSEALHNSVNQLSIERSAGMLTTSSRVSSLELRKLPPEILLVQDLPPDSETLNDADPDGLVRGKDSRLSPRRRRSSASGLFNQLCLNPRMELRTQLLLSFGTLSVISISFVVITCILSSIIVGENMKETNRDTVDGINQKLQGRQARYLAESLDQRLFPTDACDILHHAILDRFRGYPIASDEQIPFRETDSNMPAYPFVGPDLPLDWNVTLPDTLDDSVRVGSFGDTPISTATAFFHFQGICDPFETDTTSITFSPGCSELNNDLETGGLIRPSNLTRMIHRKSADLIPLLKALYEYYADVIDIGFFLENNGAGATVSFPASTLNGTSTYTSVGCDWMRERNPYDESKSIGTEEMIENCRPNGTVVPTRHYNPMERAWCMNQALNPDKIVYDGPYANSWSETLLVFFGRALYERTTDEFMGCIYVGMDIAFLDNILIESRVYPNSHVSIVRSNEGSVMASSAWDIAEQGFIPSIFDLNVGVTKEAFEFLDNLFDFSIPDWDPVNATERFEKVYKGNGYFLTAHPFPPIPGKYDAKYRPDHLAIISNPASDVFETVNDANDNVDDRVDSIILFSGVTGCCGILMAALIVLVMASSITAPLQYMNETAKRIVNSFGDTSDKTYDFADCDKTTFWLRFTPKTEITDVVNEFRKMVSSFSGGSLMARDEDAKYFEVASQFAMRTTFADLYKSRAKSSEMIFSLKPCDEAIEDSINTGSNLVVEPEWGEDAKVRVYRQTTESSRGFSSALFLWTVTLIVIPLLLTMITIAIVSMTMLTREFDQSIADSEDFLVSVETRNIEITTDLRSAFASTEASRPIRDLYLMTRYASWLLFGALQLSDGLPSFYNIVDQCKIYSLDRDCPEVHDINVCDCDLEDADLDCAEFPEASRHLLKPYIIVQSDSALANGTRWSTVFPNMSYSRETTQWWRTEDLPGRSNISSSSSLYSTSFDRARVIAATSPLLLAIKQYETKRSFKRDQFFAFSDDGMFLGSAGCRQYDHAVLARVQATAESERQNQELCPEGKFGYDPRCRSWYDSAKKNAHDVGVSLYVTAPYQFAGNKSIAQSAVSRIVDPRTGYYVGQGLYDFMIDPILDALSSKNTPTKEGGFPLLITRDTNGGDTVIAPNFDPKITPAVKVASVVIPNDVKCAAEGNLDCARRKTEFDSIVNSMKDCREGSTSFMRGKESGLVEKMYISYAPVRTIFFDPADSTDFAEGVNHAFHSCIYSLAFLETEQGVKQPFRQVESDLRQQTRIAVACLSCLIFFALVVAILISYNVARSIVEPMLYLLEMIRSVDNKGLDQPVPKFDIKRGSKETMNASNTMETLYEVVRFANVAFYAGEFEVAYRVLQDSLRIFRGVGNDKAVSVACNNIGNTLLLMFLDMKHDNVDSKFGLSRKDIIKIGTAYYHEAIKLGEAAYDEFYSREGWTPNCLDFMQHLSNRYFNRAMFLLTIKDDHDQPVEIERLGLRDLQISRDMDVEIIDQGEEVGWGRLNRAQKLFQVRLTRVRGLLLLLEMGYPDDWDIREMLDELLRMLNLESTKDSSDLFRSVGYVGRLQQVETELMKYCIAQDEILKAAQIAVRPLFEDEYILAEAKAQAIQVLLAYLKLNGDKWDKAVRNTLRKWLEDSMDAVSIGLESERQSVVSETVLSVFSKSFVSRGSSSGPQTNSFRPSSRFSLQETCCVTMEKF